MRLSSSSLCLSLDSFQLQIARIDGADNAHLAYVRYADDFISELHFHDLRRELASTLRESGAPDHIVADVLGHANISTTSRYLKASRAV